MGTNRTVFQALSSATYLDVSGGSIPLYLMGSGGKIAIGSSSSPQYKIDLKTTGTDDGISISQGTSSSAALHLTGGGGRHYALFSTGSGSSQGANHFSIYDYANSVDRFIIKSDGKVGIGTTSPLGKLQVSDATDAVLAVYTESNNKSRIASMNSIGSYAFGIDANGIGHIWNHYTNLNPIMNFSINATNSTPQVWIGTPDPTHTFAEFQVKGTIACQQLFVVSNTVWPDYVFKKEYELMPLRKVEEFYTKENHLPGIPSAQEIKEKDIDVGEMNALLLKKIEELTIYVVEQDKKIEALKTELKNK